MQLNSIFPRVSGRIVSVKLVWIRGNPGYKYDFNFPCVIKPTDGSGSKGVTKFIRKTIIDEIPQFFNLSVGGGQRVVMELAKNIDLSRYCLKVICSGVEQFNSVEESIRSVCDIEFLNLQGHVKATDIFKVMKCISKFKPDIVHAHLGGVTYAVPWSILHRKPLVVTAHTIPEKAFSKKNEMQLKALNHFIIYTHILFCHDS